MQEFFIKEEEKDIEISWPSKDAVRLSNAILHTYALDKHKDPELEIPIARIYELFRRSDDEKNPDFIMTLIDEILAEPVAVSNKTLDHKLIEWATYDLFTLLEPLGVETQIIKLRINLEYIRIMKEFVINPYIEL